MIEEEDEIQTLLDGEYPLDRFINTGITDVWFPE